MSQILDSFSTFTSSFYSSAWAWFSTLTREEWIVVLATVSICGFLSFFGMGLRNR